MESRCAYTILGVKEILAPLERMWHSVKMYFEEI
jgi:hypothetical protein